MMHEDLNEATFRIPKRAKMKKKDRTTKEKEGERKSCTWR